MGLKEKSQWSRRANDADDDDEEMSFRRAGKFLKERRAAKNKIRNRFRFHGPKEEKYLTEYFENSKTTPQAIHYSLTHNRIDLIDNP